MPMHLLFWILMLCLAGFIAMYQRGVQLIGWVLVILLLAALGYDLFGPMLRN